MAKRQPIYDNGFSSEPSIMEEADLLTGSSSSLDADAEFPISENYHDPVECSPSKKQLPERVQCAIHRLLNCHKRILLSDNKYRKSKASKKQQKRVSSELHGIVLEYKRRNRCLKSGYRRLDVELRALRFSLAQQTELQNSGVLHSEAPVHSNLPSCPSGDPSAMILYRRLSYLESEVTRWRCAYDNILERFFCERDFVDALQQAFTGREDLASNNLANHNKPLQNNSRQERTITQNANGNSTSSSHRCQQRVSSSEDSVSTNPLHCGKDQIIFYDTEKLNDGPLVFHSEQLSSGPLGISPSPKKNQRCLDMDIDGLRISQSLKSDTAPEIKECDDVSSVFSNTPPRLEAIVQPQMIDESYIKSDLSNVAEPDPDTFSEDSLSPRQMRISPFIPKSTPIAPPPFPIRASQSTGQPFESAVLMFQREINSMWQDFEANMKLICTTLTSHKVRVDIAVCKLAQHRQQISVFKSNIAETIGHLRDDFKNCRLLMTQFVRGHAQVRRRIVSEVQNAGPWIRHRRNQTIDFGVQVSSTSTQVRHPLDPCSTAIEGRDGCHASHTRPDAIPIPKSRVESQQQQIKALREISSIAQQTLCAIYTRTAISLPNYPCPFDQDGNFAVSERHRVRMLKDLRDFVISRHDRLLAQAQFSSSQAEHLMNLEDDARAAEQTLCQIFQGVGVALPGFNSPFDCNGRFNTKGACLVRMLAVLRDVVLDAINLSRNDIYDTKSINTEQVKLSNSYQIALRPGDDCSQAVLPLHHGQHNSDDTREPLVICESSDLSGRHRLIEFCIETQNKLIDFAKSNTVCRVN